MKQGFPFKFIFNNGHIICIIIINLLLFFENKPNLHNNSIKDIHIWLYIYVYVYSFAVLSWMTYKQEIIRLYVFLFSQTTSNIHNIYNILAIYIFYNNALPSNICIHGGSFFSNILSLDFLAWHFLLSKFSKWFTYVFFYNLIHGNHLFKQVIELIFFFFASEVIYILVINVIYNLLTYL